MNFDKYGADLGWKLIPLFGITDESRCECGSSHERDNSAGKHPKIVNAQNDASADFQRIRIWAESTTNFGFFCGASDIAVIDIDPRNGGFESWERLTASMPGVLPRTVEAWTGIFFGESGLSRGVHLYFKVPSLITLRKNFGNEFPGIDIKYNGYVLLPGSKHVSGVFYEWKEGGSPFEVDVAEMPKFLLNQIVKRTDGPSNTEGIIDLSGYATEVSPYGRAALDAECQDLRRTREGGRNSKLFEIGIRIGSLIGGGHIPAEVALEELVQAATAAGLDEKEAVITLLRPNGSGALQLGAANPRGPEVPSPEMLTWLTQASSGESPADGILSASEPGTHPSFLNVVDWEIAFGAEFEEPWLVPGVLSADRAHVLYSDAGLGKSLITLEICAGLAAGTPVLGFPARDPVRILYLDHENSVLGDIVPRLRSMGFEAESLTNLIYASFPEMAPLDLKEGGLQLEKALDSVKPDFVVIDTISRAVDGEENSNSTWLNFYMNAGLQFKRRGLGYLRLDHIGKVSGQGMRGGSAKKSDVDLVWRLTANKKLTNFRLTNEKSRASLISEVVEVRRNTQPFLSHQVIDITSEEINWPDLIQNYLPFAAAVELIELEVIESGSFPGQKEMWSKLKDKAAANRVTNAVFISAHRFLKNQEEEDQSGNWA